MKITKLHLKYFKVFNDLELDFIGKDGQPLNQPILIRKFSTSPIFKLFFSAKVVCIYLHKKVFTIPLLIKKGQC